MSAHREEMIELCAALALGTIEERDRSRLESHLAEGCPECAAALRNHGYAATLLAASAPRVLPLPGVRDRVLAAVAAEEQASEGARGVRRERGHILPLAPPRRPGWIAWTGWVVAAVLAVTSGTFYESGGRLRAMLLQRQTDVDGMARDLAIERQWSGVLTSPTARVADLEPPPGASLTKLGEAAAIRGRAVYDPASRRAVIVLTNAAAPESLQYALWAVRGLSSARLGLVRPDAHGAAVLRLESVGEPMTLTGFAVSLEAKASQGRAAPAGPVVLNGVLKR